MRRRIGHSWGPFAGLLVAVFEATTSTPVRAQLFGCEQNGTCQRIEDSEFIESDWTKGFLPGAPLPNPGNATETAVREIVAGNSGAWRHMVHNFLGQPPSSLHVYHLYRGEDYRPSLQGAITGIDYSNDHTTFFNDVKFDVILVQDVLQGGVRLFRYDPGLEIEAPVDGQWETYQAPHCLQASDFVADDGGPPPNFSATGGALRFGYSRRNNNQEGLPFRWESGIDNFRVIVYRQPNPGCDGGPALLRITKTDHGHAWVNDPVIPYDITVTNVGGTAAASLPVTEIVPVNTTWVAAASSPGWSCSPGPGENSRCTYLLPILQPGGSQTLHFAVRVNPGTPPAWEVYNSVSVNPADWVVTEYTVFIAETCVCFFLGLGCSERLETRDPLEGHELALTTVPRADSQTFDQALLFELRDRVLRGTSGGRRATQLFFDSVGALVSSVRSTPNGFALGNQFILAWQPLWRQLLEGRGHEVTVTTQHTQALLNYVNALVQSATTDDLKDSLALERARLDIPSWVGMDMSEWLQAINVLSCEPNDRVLCLNDGRFRVEAEWLTDQGVQGHGHAVPLTEDTGYFWFFDDANVELVLKVLDACPGGFHNYWVFAGGLTDVNTLVTVTDTETGQVRTYENPQKTSFQPIQDTAAFATCEAPPRAGSRRAEPGAIAHATLDPPRPLQPTRGARLTTVVERVIDGTRRLLGVSASAALVSRAGNCSSNATRLCLNDGRFAVTADWTTVAGTSGVGQAVSLTADTGYFWFFDEDNVEIVVKTLDACAGPFDSFWVFAAGLTDVKVDLRVVDTVTGTTRAYHNPQKTRFLPIQDTAAFKTCGAGA